MLAQTDIFIFAAENSAEKYASMVVDEFSKKPEYTFFGIGGNQLKKSGVDIIYDSKELSIVGIIEVLSSIIKLKKLMNYIIKEIRQRGCKTAILIDYPDFNLRLAKKLKKAGVSVYYYISPTVWAWRYSRVNQIRNYIKRIFIIFPFEKAIYEKEKIPYTYTGHPIVSKVKARETKAQFIEREKINSDENIVTLMPGSRHSEIDFLLEPILESIELLKKIKNIRIFLLLADNIGEKTILDKTQNFPNLKITIYKQKDGYSLISSSNLVISTSGTSNLEIALLGTPFVSVYKVNKLSYFLGKRFVKINLYSIVNILAGKKVITELIQENLSPKNIFIESKKILEDKEYVKTMLEEFRKMKLSLIQEENPSTIIYKTILKEIEELK